MSVTADTTLTENHSGRITIDADNVTLDCDGHVVQGPGSGTGTGVLVFGHDGVTIVNCDIRDFSIGIHLESAVGTVVQDNALSGNPQNGILLIRGANNSTLSGNTLSSNANESITVVESTGNSLDQNVVDDTNKGIYLGDSDANSITNNLVTRGWSWFTIALGDGSDNNTVSGNTVSITGIGILIDASSGNTIADNTASIADEGIGLFNGAKNNTISGNDSSNNRRNGFIADVGGNTGNTFTSNTAHRNGKYGFEDTTAGNTYSDNSCLRNTLGGSHPTGLCNESGTFSDDDGSVFEFDIEWMAAAGITKGCNPPTNDLFCPDSTVTRGQMAAFLVRALDLTDDGGGDLFTDDDESIFEGDIDRMATAGITKGCNPPDNDRFCPDSKVTRGQMAAFLVRALGYTDDGGGDLFTDDDGSVFEGDIDRLGTAGVTRGCNPPTNNRYCPDSAVTRGQMAAFLHRALG
jgi:parallel beta-helix repeat protein